MLQLNDVHVEILACMKSAIKTNGTSDAKRTPILRNATNEHEIGDMSSSHTDLHQYFPAIRLRSPSSAFDHRLHCIA